MNSSKFLVLGATGKTGRRIVHRLLESGHDVRQGSRHSATSFDWNDRDTWSAALAGVDSVYICYSPDLAVPGATDTIRAFVDQAVQHGVSRLVLLSGRGEKEAQECEKIVQDSGVAWTVVRASWFSQNFSEGPFVEMVQAGEIALPVGDVGEPFVDAEDIADVAFAALTEDGHSGQVYEVTGPRLLTFADAMQEVSQAMGRPVRYVQIRREAFAEGVAASGAPADIAWLMDYLFSTVMDGRNAYLSDGVKRALGREPRDFAEYVSRTVADGAWKVSA